jgi:ornithine lipid hydroxylase
VTRQRDRGRDRLTGWRALLGDHGYLLILGGALTVAGLALRAGWSPASVPALVVPAVALLCGALERALPYTATWHPDAKRFFIDLAHALTSAFGMAPLVRTGALVGVVALGATFQGDPQATPWPDEWPLALQAVLAVLVADVGAYFAHRMMHLTRVGWRVHAVHHSPTRLHFLASARSHPFNITLTLGAETIIVLALGANPESLALMTVFKGCNGLLQHSNIDLRPGALSGVVATNEVHWWHHSVHLEESNRNFGNSTMVWDRVFGTFFLPPGRPPGVRVGVLDADIPENFLLHQITPFLLGRYERRAAERTASGPTAEDDGGGVRAPRR